MTFAFFCLAMAIVNAIIFADVVRESAPFMYWVWFCLSTIFWFTYFGYQIEEYLK
jgi:hypothetical protein